MGIVKAFVGGIASLFGGGDDGGGSAPPPAPTKIPQASKAPAAAVFRRANAGAAGPGGALAGNSGTFLTGPGGVSDNNLSLGKSTLLGQ